MSVEGWLINGLPASDFDVEDVVVGRLNQDDDYAELVLPQDYDADLPAEFANGAQISLRHEDAPHAIFNGKIDAEAMTASWTAERRSVTAFGPWHFMARTPFLHEYPYINGSADTTHAVFGGHLGDILATIIGRCIAAGLINSDVSKSGYDVPAIDVPPTDAYDLTIADAIKSVLKWVPGTLVTFNYAYTPPSIFLLKPGSVHAETLAPIMADGDNLTCKPRHDLLLDGVRLDYEVAEVRNTRSWSHPMGYAPIDTTVTTYDGFRLQATDSAGATSGRVLRKTIPLSGGRTVVKLDWAVRLSELALEDLWSLSNWGDINTFFVFNCSNWGMGYASAPAGTTLGVVVTAVTDGFTVPTSAGTSAGWQWLTRTDTGGGGPAYDNFALRRWPDQILYSADYAGGLKIVQADLSLTFPVAAGERTHVARAFFAYGSSGNKTGSRYIIEGTAETPPTGIAAAVLSAHGRLQWEGTVSVQFDSPGELFSGTGLKRNIHFRKPYVDSPIQRMVFKASTNVCDLAFGPPTHLGPQDRLTLFRARR
jgi:hypothetical protein